MEYDSLMVVARSSYRAPSSSVTGTPAYHLPLWIVRRCEKWVRMRARPKLENGVPRVLECVDCGWRQPTAGVALLPLTMWGLSTNIACSAMWPDRVEKVSGMWRDGRRTRNAQLCVHWLLSCPSSSRSSRRSSRRPSARFKSYRSTIIIVLCSK